MNDAFNQAFTQLIGNEGGYTVDDGGPTNFGVTEAVARTKHQDFGFLLKANLIGLLGANPRSSVLSSPMLRKSFLPRMPTSSC